MPKHNEHLINSNETVSTMLPTLRPAWHDVLVLLLGYVVLDWASFIHPLYGLNITAWNPAPALGLLFLLRFGNYAILPLALAILLADAWVRNLPVSLLVSFGLSTLLTLGYWAIAEVLRHRLSSRSIFNDRRGLLEWAVIVTLGTLVNSVIYVVTLSLGQLIPIGEVPGAFIRYWVGDCVGVLVSMPVLWMLLDDHGRAQLRAMVVTWESLAYLLAVGGGAMDRFWHRRRRRFQVLLCPFSAGDVGGCQAGPGRRRDQHHLCPDRHHRGSSIAQGVGDHRA